MSDSDSLPQDERTQWRQDLANLLFTELVLFTLFGRLRLSAPILRVRCTKGTHVHTSN